MLQKRACKFTPEKFDDIKPWGQYHQHFQGQNRIAFAQIFFDTKWQDHSAKMWKNMALGKKTVAKNIR